MTGIHVVQNSVGVKDSSSTDFRLGNVVVSAVALSLHEMLEMYKILADIEQKSYKLQQDSVHMMSEMAKKNAEFTYKALEDQAIGAKYNAWGSISGGILSTAGAAGGLRSYVKTSSQLEPLHNDIAAMGKNSETMGTAINPDPAKVKPDVQVEANAEAKNAIPYEQVKADVDHKVATNQPIEAEKAQDLANANKADAEAIKKDLDNKRSEKMSEARSLEGERDTQINLIQMFSKTSDIVSGGFQTGAANKKVDEANDEARKTDASTAQQVMQGVVERQNQGISSFDSLRQSVHQAQSEMAASNRV